MNHSLGDMIRELRKERKLTQEDLADGICSAVSISRIENGNQMPSNAILERLLERLGTSTYEICNVYFQNEKQQEFEKLAEQAGGALTEGKIREAEDFLNRLKSYEEKDPHFLQTVLLVEGTIQFFQSDPNCIRTLETAIRQTKPEIQLEDLRNILFDVTEVNTICVLSAAYDQWGEVLRAIRIGEELYRAMEKHHSHLKSFGVLRINVAMNLSQFLCKEGRYEEALAYITRAEAISDEISEMSLLPEVEFLKAKILFFTHKTEECKRIIQAIVPYMELIHKDHFAEMAKEFATSQLGLFLNK